MSDLAFLLLLVGLIIQAIAFGVAGGILLQPLDRYGSGFALGFFLGTIGLVIAWGMRANGLLERPAYDSRHRARRTSRPLRPRSGVNARAGRLPRRPDDFDDSRSISVAVAARQRVNTILRVGIPGIGRPTLSRHHASAIASWRISVRSSSALTAVPR